MYLINYGYDPNEIFKKTIEMFDESFVHYERMLLQTEIAGLLGFDLNTDRGWLLFIGQFREHMNIRRGHAKDWETGQVDIPLTDLKIIHCYLNIDVYLDNTNPTFKLIEPLRFAIARSITFLRLLPPTSGTDFDKLQDAEDFSSDLRCCWKYLEKHPSFSLTKRGAPFSQRSLDCATLKFGKELRVAPNMIGDLKANLVNPRRDERFAIWFFPFMIFWYATTCNLSTGSTKKVNPRSTIWNPSLQWYENLWSC